MKSSLIFPSLFISSQDDKFQVSSLLIKANGHSINSEYDSAIQTIRKVISNIDKQKEIEDYIDCLYLISRNFQVKGFTDSVGIYINKLDSIFLLENEVRTEIRNEIDYFKGWYYYRIRELVNAPRTRHIPHW